MRKVNKQYQDDLKNASEHSFSRKQNQLKH